MYVGASGKRFEKVGGSRVPRRDEEYKVSKGTAVPGEEGRRIDIGERILNGRERKIAERSGSACALGYTEFLRTFPSVGCSTPDREQPAIGGAASLRPPPFRPPSFREDREKGHGKVSHGESSASSQTCPRFRTPLFPPLIFLRREFARNENWRLRSGEGKTWIGFANEVRRAPRPSLVEGGGGKGSKGVIVNVNRSPVT